MVEVVEACPGDTLLGNVVSEVQVSLTCRGTNGGRERQPLGHRPDFPLSCTLVARDCKGL
eukprot:scaffold143756_cov20-Tisochrysis_lutea.AAC.2